MQHESRRTLTSRASGPRARLPGRIPPILLVLALLTPPLTSFAHGREEAPAIGCSVSAAQAATRAVDTPETRARAEGRALEIGGSGCPLAATPTADGYLPRRSLVPVPGSTALARWQLAHATSTTDT